MEFHDDAWRTTIEISGESRAIVDKRAAAVRRLLRQLEKDKPKPARAPGEGALYKRGDGIWAGRVELPVAPDGSRRRSRPVYSTDRATAIAKLETLKADIAAGREQLDQFLTVEAWLSYWIDEIAKPRMRPHAWKTYRGLINNQIVPALGSRRLATLKPEHIRGLHKHILASSYTRTDKDTGEPVEIPYSTRTVEAAHNVLSAALGDAVAEAKAHRNVCEIVTKPPVLSTPRGTLTAEQARNVLVAAMRADDRLVTRWAAGLMLGGRQGEMLGLQWERVDLERGTLDLSWQLEWLPLHADADPEDPGRFDVPAGFDHLPLWRGAALTRPKTDTAQRIIPIPAPLGAILSAHRSTWEPNPWDLVWVTGRGTPISDRADREAWAEALLRVHAPNVVVHAMRGTTATLLLEAGVDAHVIASIMGHAEVVTTRGYQRVDQRLAREALGNLDGLLRLESSEPMSTPE